MRAFRDFSIRRKLRLIIMLTSSVALLLACTVFITYDRYSFRRGKVEDLTALADIIGSNSTAALAFGDADSAREILGALRAKQHIVAACVYGRDGRVFACYARGNPATPVAPPPVEGEGSRFGSNQLVVFRGIVLDGEKIGTVYLQADLGELRERLNRYTAVLLPVVLGSLLVAFLLSSRLQRAISEPIRDLAWTTKLVSFEEDYSVRAVKHSNDELGLLIEGFNEMLTQIQRRDTALQAAQSQLEKRVEERTAELQASEQRFGLLSVSGPVGIFQTDAQGRYTYANEGWAQALPPEDRETVVQRWSKAAREGREFLLEFRVCTPEGNLRWVRSRGTPVRSDEGGITGYVGTLADITEPKRVEEALRESEERTRLLLDSTAEAIYGVDIEGSCTFCNAATLRLLGYQHSDDLLGKNMQALVHHSRSDGNPQIHCAFPRGEGTHVDDELLWRADGTSFPVEFWSYPIHRGGQVVGSVMTFVDITERKRAERQLEERTAYLNALIENSPVAIVGHDSQDVVQMCNPAFERMFLYRPEDVVGAKLDDLIKSEELESEVQSITNRVLKGESVHLTTRRRRRDGTLLDVDLHAVPLMIGGKLLGAFGLYQDITERKRAEEELRKAKEAAEAASRAKSEFLANMSHEIRTPMNGIMGMTELALDTELTLDQREYLAMVKASADSLLRVINDILDFSKIEAGKLDMDRVEFNLRDILGETLRALAIRAHRKGLELSYRVEPAVPARLLGDPGRLRQLIVNLVGNAIKFTNSGEVVVGVEIESMSSDAVRLHFVVSDTGIGISPEKQKQIF